MLQSFPTSEKGGRSGPAQSQDAAQDAVAESQSNEEKEAGSQPNSHAVHCWAQHRMKLLMSTAQAQRNSISRQTPPTPKQGQPQEITS